jgi:hypothetical protein
VPSFDGVLETHDRPVFFPSSSARGVRYYCASAGNAGQAASESARFPGVNVTRDLMNVVTPLSHGQKEANAGEDSRCSGPTSFHGE